MSLGVHRSLGVFLFPILQTSLGLRGTLLLTAGVSAAGALLTLILPEPSGRTLEEISGHTDQDTATASSVVATPAA
jgi:MFS transporter, PHS family, inorganic phosphate transporter